MYLDNVIRHSFRSDPSVTRRFDGVDVFVEWNGAAQQLAKRLEAQIDGSMPFDLALVSNWGTMMTPSPTALENTMDQWRCRFMYTSDDPNIDEPLADLLSSISTQMPWIQVEKLMSFDGVPGYGRMQHQA